MNREYDVRWRWKYEIETIKIYNESYKKQKIYEERQHILMSIHWTVEMLSTKLKEYKICKFYWNALIKKTCMKG